MKSISSRDNPQFKSLHKLASSARQRRQAGQTLLDGAHLLAAYLASGGLPQQLFVTASGAQNAEITALLARCPTVEVTQFSDALFSELSELKSPSGVLALIALPTCSPTDSADFCLLLEDIQDPGNLGSMLRSAGAAGCDRVFLSANCADVWSPKVLRAAMGGHFLLKIQTDSDLVRLAGKFNGTLFATSLQGKKTLYEIDCRGALGFAFGNEGAGISAELRQAIRQQILIPMSGKLESLNVAAAAAICLFEAVRKRNLN